MGTIDISDEMREWLETFDKTDPNIALYKIKETYVNKKYALEELSKLRTQIHKMEYAINNHLGGC